MLEESKVVTRYLEREFDHNLHLLRTQQQETRIKSDFDREHHGFREQLEWRRTKKWRKFRFRETRPRLFRQHNRGTLVLPRKGAQSRNITDNRKQRQKRNRADVMSSDDEPAPSPSDLSTTVTLMPPPDSTFNAEVTALDMSTVNRVPY